MKSGIKLIYGVGINDADYPVYVYEKLNGKNKIIWRCPFYSRWCDMLKRCYSEKYLKTGGTYKGCFVCEEWKRFSNFKAWMETQDWQNKQLDKDLLLKGNKVYSPDTCVFISIEINLFISEKLENKSKYKTGVSINNETGLYRAKCNDGTGRTVSLGSFKEEETAHKKWLSYKLELAKILAASQTDERVAKALIERYENYEIFN